MIKVVYFEGLTLSEITRKLANWLDEYYNLPVEGVRFWQDNETAFWNIAIYYWDQK